MKVNKSASIKRWFEAIGSALLVTSLVAPVVHAFEKINQHANHDMQQAENDPHAHHRMAAAKAADMSMTRIEIPENIQMLNQYGDAVDLKSDVLDDRIVVINFIYTRCTTVCPVVSSIFSLLQTNLGELLNKEVGLVTITVDPTRDSPHQLQQYANKFNPVAGWSWLTGDKKSVDKVNTLLGSYTPNFEDHPAMMLVGDSATGEWYRFLGFPAPEALDTRVRELLARR